MNRSGGFPALTFALGCVIGLQATLVADDWPQLQGNAQHSGDAPHVSLPTSLGLVAAIPLTDAVLAAPVVSDGKAFVVDASGVVFAIDTQTLEPAARIIAAITVGLVMIGAGVLYAKLVAAEEAGTISEDHEPQPVPPEPVPSEDSPPDLSD